MMSKTNLILPQPASSRQPTAFRTNLLFEQAKLELSLAQLSPCFLDEFAFHTSVSIEETLEVFKRF